jgi:hypothetical protein
LAYWFQSDSWAALLVLPRWLWIGPGLLLALLGWTRSRKRLATIVVALWLLYAYCFVEERPALMRWRRWPDAEWQACHEKGSAIRIVSLNCNGGETNAAAEVLCYQPDLILFQESPLRTELQAMSHKLAGPEAETLCGSDVSIVADGQVTPVPMSVSGNAAFAHARIRFRSGLTAEVIVIRLRPYEIRIDLWSPDCWRGQRDLRLQQRAQLEQLLRLIETIPSNVPLIVGGDFNQPGGDHLLRALQPRLRDTFDEGGIGWGNTLANNIPFLRVDQIWASDQFRVASVRARRTVYSDHRMVVCDLFCSVRSDTPVKTSK